METASIDQFRPEHSSAMPDVAKTTTNIISDSRHL